MPAFTYHSEAMQECARRGRRAMMLHPDWRNRTSSNGGRIPWEMYATDLIADILHGLNSRVDHSTIVTHRNEAFGMEAVVERALVTYNSDFDEERDAMPF